MMSIKSSDFCNINIFLTASQCLYILMLRSFTLKPTPWNVSLFLTALSLALRGFHALKLLTVGLLILTRYFVFVTHTYHACHHVEV